jgi:hypothetical protein
VPLAPIPGGFVIGPSLALTTCYCRAASRAGGEADGSAVHGQEAGPTKPKQHKGRPREMSSKKPVGRFRVVVETQKRKFRGT